MKKILVKLPALLPFPATRYCIDYDADADVIDISFRKPQRATDSELREDGLIVHTQGAKIVGITTLDASKRHGGF